MADETSLLDTNVLVAAVQRARPGHAAALHLLDGPGRYALTPQVLREFLVVATRPADRNGLALPAEVAVANAERLVARTILLPEDGRVGTRLRGLIGSGRALGVPIHDANIVASALVHGVGRIVTANVADFARFADLIEIVPLI